MKLETLQKRWVNRCFGDEMHLSVYISTVKQLDKESYFLSYAWLTLSENTLPFNR